MILWAKQESSVIRVNQSEKSQSIMYCSCLPCELVFPTPSTWRVKKTISPVTNLEDPWLPCELVSPEPWTWRLKTLSSPVADTLRIEEWAQRMKSSNYLPDSKLTNDSSQGMNRFGCSVVEVLPRAWRLEKGRPPFTVTRASRIFCGSGRKKSPGERSPNRSGSHRLYSDRSPLLLPTRSMVRRDSGSRTGTDLMPVMLEERVGRQLPCFGRCLKRLFPREQAQSQRDQRLPILPTETTQTTTASFGSIGIFNSAPRDWAPTPLAWEGLLTSLKSIPWEKRPVQPGWDPVDRCLFKGEPMLTSPGTLECG